MPIHVAFEMTEDAHKFKYHGKIEIEVAERSIKREFGFSLRYPTNPRYELQVLKDGAVVLKTNLYSPSFIVRSENCRSMTQRLWNSMPQALTPIFSVLAPCLEMGFSAFWNPSGFLEGFCTNRDTAYFRAQRETDEFKKGTFIFDGEFGDIPDPEFWRRLKIACE